MHRMDVHTSGHVIEARRVGVWRGDPESLTVKGTLCVGQMSDIRRLGAHETREEPGMKDCRAGGKEKKKEIENRGIRPGLCRRSEGPSSRMQ
ncbi:hypothetical protein AAFF_G00282300 [Aldrovandia affinis]|uniref:Uncharacterized protein n=1 Tax=Aldrovandia affinis TaxID=143900 RepID=A0AAD7TB00_9TELE|nr:hypothetical protein AAFF_G00282300 [Aldrovandia affinis]